MSRLLIATGEALYGQQWQSAVARDLGVSVRSVQRWSAGQFAVPDGVMRDLHDVVEERIKLLARLSQLIGS